MQTILISGTAIPLGSKVEYTVHIWGSKEGQQIQFITLFDGIITSGYNTLWDKAKAVCVAYFDEPKFEDGAYTQYLDHLIIFKQP